jgi:CheY-like chemotaxis protein
MINNLQCFADTAKGLSRNPLGIIALFIVLVYGLACLVITFAHQLSSPERLPLIYFLVFFPILVLIIFAWLVSKHNSKLYAPSDYSNEENYVKMQIAATASLIAASDKYPEQGRQTDVSKIVEIVRNAHPQMTSSFKECRNQILWVDDRPENNVYERKAFEAIGFSFSLAVSTDIALSHLKQTNFAAVISDMGRTEGPREGYVLLDTMRKNGIKTPLFFYASSNAPEHVKETHEHGGQGCTNNAQELFDMVTKTIISNQQ